MEELLCSLSSFVSATGAITSGIAPVARPQVVLFGAGYDTRSLRYEQQGLGGARFFEVDLPPVVAGKSRLHASWKERTDRPNAELPAYVPFDLNDCLRAAADGGDGGDAARSASSALLSALRAAGLRDAPTIFVFEAVLFYVE